MHKLRDEYLAFLGQRNRTHYRSITCTVSLLQHGFEFTSVQKNRFFTGNVQLSIKSNYHSHLSISVQHFAIAENKTLQYNGIIEMFLFNNAYLVR